MSETTVRRAWVSRTVEIPSYAGHPGEREKRRIREPNTTETEAMRGADGYTESMFTMSKLDDFVPANHPLRPIRLWLNEALTRMDTSFSRMYESAAKGGRPSIAPQKLIRALLLQVLYSIRSERM